MPGGGVYYMGRFCLLFVNIDHIATLREARGGNVPDLIEAAVICEKSGCDGVTVHLREDRRYIQDRDVFALNEAIHGKLNLEISVSGEMIGIAQKVKPRQVTIVPEKRGEMTIGRGLDIRANMQEVRDAVRSLHDRKITVSLCVEPDMETIELSKECEADFAEIHTGAYGSAAGNTIDKEIERIYSAAHHAVSVGIKVSAGHGLNYRNIMPVLKSRALEQVTIGHSIICRSVFVGLSKAVQEMMDILE